MDTFTFTPSLHTPRPDPFLSPYVFYFIVSLFSHYSHVFGTIFRFHLFVFLVKAPVNLGRSCSLYTERNYQYSNNNFNNSNINFPLKRKKKNTTFPTYTTH